MLARKRHIRALLLVLFICATGLQFVTVSEASELSHEDWNYYAQTQTFAFALDFLAEMYGEPWETVSFTGTASSTGWNWSVSTTYHGLALDLTYTGTFDSGTGEMSWTGSGTYGTEPWTASGTAQFQSGEPEDTVDWDETIQVGVASDTSEITGSGNKIKDGTTEGEFQAKICVGVECSIKSKWFDFYFQKGFKLVINWGKGWLENLFGSGGQGKTKAVELSSFLAVLDDGKVILQWRTETENFSLNVSQELVSLFTSSLFRGSRRY